MLEAFVAALIIFLATVAASLVWAAITLGAAQKHETGRLSSIAGPWLHCNDLKPRGRFVVLAAGPGSLYGEGVYWSSRPDGYGKTGFLVRSILARGVIRTSSQCQYAVSPPVRLRIIRRVNPADYFGKPVGAGEWNGLRQLYLCEPVEWFAEESANAKVRLTQERSGHMARPRRMLHIFRALGSPRATLAARFIGVWLGFVCYLFALVDYRRPGRWQSLGRYLLGIGGRITLVNPDGLFSGRVEHLPSGDIVVRPAPTHDIFWRVGSMILRRQSDQVEGEVEDTSWVGDAQWVGVDVFDFHPQLGQALSPTPEKTQLRVWAWSTEPRIVIPRRLRGMAMSFLGMANLRAFVMPFSSDEGIVYDAASRDMAVSNAMWPALGGRVFETVVVWDRSRRATRTTRITRWTVVSAAFVIGALAPIIALTWPVLLISAPVATLAFLVWLLAKLQGCQVGSLWLAWFGPLEGWFWDYDTVPPAPASFHLLRIMRGKMGYQKNVVFGWSTWANQRQPLARLLHQTEAINVPSIRNVLLGLTIAKYGETLAEFVKKCPFALNDGHYIVGWPYGGYTTAIWPPEAWPDELARAVRWAKRLLSMPVVGNLLAWIVSIPEEMEQGAED